MNRISDLVATTSNTCSENLRREEKRPQWRGYNERSRTRRYPDTPGKRLIEEDALLFPSTTIDNISVGFAFRRNQINLAV